MLYVIYATDYKDNVKRNEHYEAHKLYLSNCVKAGLNLVVSGPLMDVNGTNAIGSLFIVEGQSIDDALLFHHSDPFFIAGIWQTSFVTPFIRRR